MRMLVHAKIPNDPFNAAVKDGTVGAKIKKILDELKPEATYFMEYDGHRSTMMILDMADSSKIPSIAEPWFLLFNAKCEFRPVMTPEDLGKAGLEAIGKKWA
jgi:hypothetical protein